MQFRVSLEDGAYTAESLNAPIVTCRDYWKCVPDNLAKFPP